MSRDQAPKRDLIDATTAALRAAGHDAETDIDPTPRDSSAIEADFAARAATREQKYTARAQQHQASSDASHDRADQLSHRLAGGQPILIGHHSQAGAERDHRRMAQQMHKSIDEREAANYATARARDAASAVESRGNPVTVANRIERLAADVRKYERQLKTLDPTGESTNLPRTREKLAHLKTALTHWEQVRQQQIDDGTSTNYGPQTVHVGDAVKISGTWWRVIRRTGNRSPSRPSTAGPTARRGTKSRTTARQTRTPSARRQKVETESAH